MYVPLIQVMSKLGLEYNMFEFYKNIVLWIIVFLFFFFLRITQYLILIKIQVWIDVWLNSHEFELVWCCGCQKYTDMLYSAYGVE